jgi:hypothetical protein
MAESPESKMRSTDRVLVLSVIDGKDAKRTTGLVDTNLFTGSNTLHAKMDPETSFWYLQYEKGILPEPLKNKYTSFKILLKFVTEYFQRRNIEIKEIKD